MEDLAGTGNHVDLFSNTALDSHPLAGGLARDCDIVDAVGTQCGGYGSSNGPAVRSRTT